MKEMNIPQAKMNLTMRNSHKFAINDESLE